MLVLSIEYFNNLFSISISEKKKIFYKEFYGPLLSSNYLLESVKKILIKNKLNYNKINIIIIGYINNSFTGNRIFYSMIQTLSIIHSIPFYQIKKNIKTSFYKKKHAYFITKMKKKYKIFFISHNLFFLLYKKININNFIYIKRYCFIIKNDCYISKSIYINLIYEKIKKKKYILPNSTEINFTNEKNNINK